MAFYKGIFFRNYNNSKQLLMCLLSCGRSHGHVEWFLTEILQFIRESPENCNLFTCKYIKLYNDRV